MGPVLERTIGKQLGGIVDECDLSFQQFTLTSFKSQSTATVGRYALTYLPPLIEIYRHLYRGTKSWAFQPIVKCEDIPDVNKRLRKYQRPRFEIIAPSTPREGEFETEE